MAIVYSWKLNGGLYGYIINPDNVKVHNGSMISPYDYTDNELVPCITEGKLHTSDEAKVKSWVSMLEYPSGDKDPYGPYRTCFEKLAGNKTVTEGGNIFLPVDDYINAPADCDNLRGPRGYTIEKIVHGWNDESKYEDSELLDYYAIMNDKESTRIHFTIPRGPKGNDGADGVVLARIPVNAYMVLREGIVPDVPVGGSYDLETETVTYPEIKIIGKEELRAEMFPENTIPKDRRCIENPYRAEGFNTWCSCGVFGVDGNGDSFMKIGWSDPFILHGENGEDGADGENTQFMYYRTDDTNIENKPIFLPSGTKEENIEYGWTDNPSGIDRKYKIEWMIYRNRDKSVNDKEAWGDWNSPVIWSKWGEDGHDGDGIEYIYRLTKPGQLPLVGEDLSYDEEHRKCAFTDERYTEMTNYQKNEFIPKNTAAENDSGLAKWTDNPTRSDNDGYEKEWVCVRKRKTNENGERTWGKFSYPSIWSEKGEKGATGDTGVSGIPGVGFSLRYHIGDGAGPKNITETGEAVESAVPETFAFEESKFPGWTDNYNLVEKNEEKSLTDVWAIQARTLSSVTPEGEIVEEFAPGEKWSMPFPFTSSKGKDGEKAPIIYPEGYYSPNKAYCIFGNKAPYVWDGGTNNYYVFNKRFNGDPTNIWYGGSKEDPESKTYDVEVDGKIYQVPTQMGKTPGEAFEDPLTKGYWEKMESFEAVYSKIGIIANGMIGEAVFNNQFMFSQTGKNKEKKTVNSYDSFLSGYELKDGKYFLKSNGTISVENPDPYESINDFYPNYCVNFKTGEVWMATGSIYVDKEGKTTWGKYGYSDNPIPEVAKDYSWIESTLGSGASTEIGTGLVMTNMIGLKNDAPGSQNVKSFFNGSGAYGLMNGENGFYPEGDNGSEPEQPGGGEVKPEERPAEGTGTLTVKVARNEFDFNDEQKRLLSNVKYVKVKLTRSDGSIITIGGEKTFISSEITTNSGILSLNNIPTDTTVTVSVTDFLDSKKNTIKLLNVTYEYYSHDIKIIPEKEVTEDLFSSKWTGNTGKINIGITVKKKDNGGIIPEANTMVLETIPEKKDNVLVLAAGVPDPLGQEDNLSARCNKSAARIYEDGSAHFAKDSAVFYSDGSGHIGMPYKDIKYEDSKHSDEQVFPIRWWNDGTVRVHKDTVYGDITVNSLDTLPNSKNNKILVKENYVSSLDPSGKQLIRLSSDTLSLDPINSLVELVKHGADDNDVSMTNKGNNPVVSTISMKCDEFLATSSEREDKREIIFPSIKFTGKYTLPEPGKDEYGIPLVPGVNVELGYEWLLNGETVASGSGSIFLETGQTVLPDAKKAPNNILFSIPSHSKVLPHNLANTNKIDLVFKTFEDKSATSKNYYYDVTMSPEDQKWAISSTDPRMSLSEICRNGLFVRSKETGSLFNISFRTEDDYKYKKDTIEFSIGKYELKIDDAGIYINLGGGYKSINSTSTMIDGVSRQILYLE